jgi:hypothetical protein
MTRPAQPYRWWKRVGVAAVAACGVCCAAPLIALLGGFGALSAVGTVVEGFEMISLVLAVIALGGAGVLWLGRRRRACRVPDRIVDLGMPAPTRDGKP